MNIICPILGINEQATEESILNLVSLLKKKDDPFLILEKDEMTYMQTLWTPKGYILEYQDGTTSEHYWLSEPTTKENAIWALQSYLNNQPYWKNKFSFVKKEITTPSFKLGHFVGTALGRLLRKTI